MVQCSRCRNQVDETMRKTCPTCLTPLPSALPASTLPTALSAPPSNAIPLAAPKAQPVPPSQSANYGAAPMPGYAPPMPNNGYAPQPGSGSPLYPASPAGQPGYGAPMYPGATGQTGGYAPSAYPSRPSMPPPVQQPRSSGGSAFSGTFPWWRVCLIVSAVCRALYWGTHTHQDRVITPVYTPSYTSINTFAPATPVYTGPAYTQPTYTRPAYMPPMHSYQNNPSSSMGSPYGYGQSHFAPPTIPQPHFAPPMPVSHFGSGPRFGRP